MLIEFENGEILTAGCDEAGRGCLAGPVFAAAVILPDGFQHPLLNDSKKMKAADRETLAAIIKTEAVAWGLGMCNHQEIDTLNILKASFEAMHRAIRALTLPPGHLLIDGNRFVPFPNLSHQCVVGGDGKYTCIAAASILAKTARDQFMEDLHNEYPEYGWDKNKAYATSGHIAAINRLGRSPYHRKSFVLRQQIKIPF